MEIIINNLKKSFNLGKDKIEVLKGVNLKINENENIIITGSSGAGKTTLLKILALLDSEFEGDVFYNRKSIKSLSEQEKALIRNKKIGYIFQEYAMIENTSVYENVIIPLLYSDVPIKEQRKKVQLLLEILELQGFENRNVSHLSGGQRQRVAIARAIINDPEMIFADEAYSSLDTRITKKLLSYMLDKKTTKNIFLVAHHLDSSLLENFKRVYLKDGIIE